MTEDKLYFLDEVEDLRKKDDKTKADEAKLAFFDKLYETDEDEDEFEELMDKRYHDDCVRYEKACDKARLTKEAK